MDPCSLTKNTRGEGGGSKNKLGKNCRPRPPFWVVIYLYMAREKFLDFGELCLTSTAKLLELTHGLQLNAQGRLGRGRVPKRIR